MRSLYAPWRMEYIGAPPEAGCLFCRVLASPPAQDAENLVVFRTDEAVALLNKFPYNPGHLMIAPHAHVPSLTDLDDERLLAVMRLARRSLSIVHGVMSPDGFNLGVNIGRVAGAGIPDHVHVHVVPRWSGDTNFMPVLADVKVVSEHLRETREKLAAAFASAG